MLLKLKAKHTSINGNYMIGSNYSLFYLFFYFIPILELYIDIGPSDGSFTHEDEEYV